MASAPDISAEPDLAAEKMRAEVRKLQAETALIEAQTAKRQAVEIAKLVAETEKMQSERKWLPFVAGAGMFAAAAGFLKLLQLI